MQRVVVVGAAGSGKTTLARAIAGPVGVEAVDIDDLFWQPGWVESDRDTLRARVNAVTAGDRWVVAGNYTRSLKDLLWHRADTLVWLDLPRRVTYRRMLARCWRDALARRELWPGCRQTWLMPLRTGLLRRGWRQTAIYRHRYEAFLAEPECAHLDVIRLRTRTDVDRLRADLALADSTTATRMASE